MEIIYKKYLRHALNIFLYVVIKSLEMSKITLKYSYLENSINIKLL